MNIIIINTDVTRSGVFICKLASAPWHFQPDNALYYSSWFSVACLCDVLFVLPAYGKTVEIEPFITRTITIAIAITITITPGVVVIVVAPVVVVSSSAAQPHREVR